MASTTPSFSAPSAASIQWSEELSGFKGRTSWCFHLYSETASHALLAVSVRRAPSAIASAEMESLAVVHSGGRVLEACAFPGGMQLFVAHLLGHPPEGCLASAISFARPESRRALASQG